MMCRNDREPSDKELREQRDYLVKLTRKFQESSSDPKPPTTGLSAVQKVMDICPTLQNTSPPSSSLAGALQEPDSFSTWNLSMNY